MPARKKEEQMTDATDLDIRETIARIDREMAHAENLRQVTRTDGWKTGAAIALAAVALVKLIEAFI